MAYRFTLIFLVFWEGGFLLYLSSEARAEPPIHYLSDQELTTDKLIEILKPPTQRGIEPAVGKPQCEKFRTNARGIAPVADIAAFRVLFDFNSADLTPAARENLDKLAAALKSTDLSSYCFRIEGHTDSIGGDAYNQGLSEKRARSTARYLAGQLRVEPSRLLPVGYGKTQPIADNMTDEGRQKNRRVQISNLGSGSESENQ
jgi:outer membrane protein OmpA-like peptidoglycan-associated protein